MSDFDEIDAKRLSDLFASGNMGHAREIARLVGREVEALQTKQDPILAMFVGRFVPGWQKS